MSGWHNLPSSSRSVPCQCGPTVGRIEPATQVESSRGAGRRARRRDSRHVRCGQRDEGSRLGLAAGARPGGRGVQRDRELRRRRALHRSPLRVTNLDGGSDGIPLPPHASHPSGMKGSYECAALPLGDGGAVQLSTACFLIRSTSSIVHSASVPASRAASVPSRAAWRRSAARQRRAAAGAVSGAEPSRAANAA